MSSHKLQTRKRAHLLISCMASRSLNMFSSMTCMQCKSKSSFCPGGGTGPSGAWKLTSATGDTHGSSPSHVLGYTISRIHPANRSGGLSRSRPKGKVWLMLCREMCRDMTHFYDPGYLVTCS
jgi:hypothetical protein